MDLSKFENRLTSQLSEGLTSNAGLSSAASQALRYLQNSLRESALELPSLGESLDEQARILNIVSSMDKAITKAFAASRTTQQMAEQVPPLESGR